MNSIALPRPAPRAGAGPGGLFLQPYDVIETRSVSTSEGAEAGRASRVKPAEHEQCSRSSLWGTPGRVKVLEVVLQQAPLEMFWYGDTRISLYRVDCALDEDGG